MAQVTDLLMSDHRAVQMDDPKKTITIKKKTGEKGTQRARRETVDYKWGFLFICLNSHPASHSASLSFVARKDESKEQTLTASKPNLDATVSAESSAENPHGIQSSS